MHRTDREIQSFDEVVSVLERCDTVTVAFGGDPYAVPVSFGICRDGDVIALYFHGAKRGMKADRLAQCPGVCVEGHIFYKVEPTANGITTRYESVIGFGRAERVSGDEIIQGLKCITAHYGYDDYPVGRCKGLEATAVWRITFDSLAGKRNLPII